MDEGADINRRNDGDPYLFDYLFDYPRESQRYFHILLFLLENGANPNIYKSYETESFDYSEISFLHYLIIQYMFCESKVYLFELIKLSIKKGADVNAKTGKGDMPLDWAMQGQDQRLIELLISHGAVNSENYLKIKDKIVTKKLRPDPFNDRIYIEDDVEKILKVINKKYDLNAIYLGEEVGSIRTILDYCVYYQSYNDYYQVTECLLKHGANPNLKVSRNAPLHIALESIDSNLYSTENAVVVEEDTDYPKPTKVIEKLIEYGADVNILNDDGLTPLDMVVETQHIWAEDILLKHEAKHSDKYYSDNKDYLENKHYNVRAKIQKNMELQNYYWNVLNKELLPKVFVDKESNNILELPKIHLAVLLNDFHLKQYDWPSSETQEKIRDKIINEVKELVKEGHDINELDKIGCTILDYHKYLHRGIRRDDIFLDILKSIDAKFSYELK